MLAANSSTSTADWQLLHHRRRCCRRRRCCGGGVSDSRRSLDTRVWCGLAMLGRARGLSCVVSRSSLGVHSHRGHQSRAGLSEAHGERPRRGPPPVTVLRPWEQAAVAVGSAVGALINPARADFVAALGETTGGPAFHLILQRMRASPEGQQILKDRPRVIASQVQHAWDMPENTLGGAYAKFMGDRNFSPDDRPAVRFLESEELAYVAQRAREVHDFWHVLFNCPTSVVGELALKMVEFQQTLLPMCFLSVAGASWRLKPEQRTVLFTHYGPWAMRAGKSARDLMCIYYEKHLHEDLDEVRNKWGIIPAPPRPKKKVV